MTEKSELTGDPAPPPAGEQNTSALNLAEFLVESTPLYAVVIGADGQAVAINQMLLDALGYAKDEILHRRFLLAAVYGPDQNKILAYRDIMWSDKPLTNEIRLQAKDGRVLLVQWHSRPVNHPAVTTKLLFCSGIDISEQLKEKEAQYRHIFEATTDGLVVADLEARRVVEVNPAFIKMHGYSLEEFSGMDPNTFVHPDSRGTLADFFATIERGEEFYGNAVNIRKDGTPFNIEVYGAPFIYQGKPHALAINRDITERVQAYQLLEQRVEERTRELSTLLEISRNVASTLELKPLLNLILDQLQVVTGYSGAGIMVVDGDEVAFLEVRQPDTPSEVPLTAVRLKIGENRPQWDRFLQDGQRIIDDVRADTEHGRYYRQFVGKRLDTNFGYVRSWMGTPMEHKGKVLGILSLSHTAPNYFTARHAALTKAIADQAATAIENARLYEQAQAVAALEERQRLARELHDSVSQALFGILVGTNSARILVDRDPSRLPQTLDYIGTLAQSGMAEMRALLFELRPESLENEGLVVAITKQAAAIKARYGLEINLKLGSEPNIPLATKEALYRIAQEAMQNTVKHAQASTINLDLQANPEQVILTLTDNGQGFDTKGSFPGHLGLKSMQERASRLGGTFSIDSQLGEGTTIRVELPSQA